MAPEQARGMVAGLDRRCDVFGLGAILCEILTGQPPYAGPTAEAVKLRALMADLAETFTRLDGCGADVELIALAKHCLASERNDRPADAAAVAVAMAAFRAAVEERARRAEVDRAAAEARTVEERKRRRWQLALAAAVVLFLAAGGSVAAWWWQQRAVQSAERSLREQETAQSVKQALAEVGRLKEAVRQAPAGEWALFRQKLEVARKAEELAHGGPVPDELRAEAEKAQVDAEADLAAAQRDRILLDRLLDVRRPRETHEYRRTESGQMQELAEPSADEQFANSFREWGLDVDAALTAKAAAQVRSRPPAVAQAIAAALDDWALELRRKGQGNWRRLAELARTCDDDPRRAELRELLLHDQLLAERTAWELSRALLPLTAIAGLEPAGEVRGRLRALAAQANPASDPPLGLALLARSLRAAGDDSAAERLLRAAVLTQPGAVVLLTALGKLLEEQRPPRWAEAIECYAAARVVRPGLGLALARALNQAGRANEALALNRELVRRRPENPALRWFLALAWHRQARLKEAEVEYREALRLKPDLLNARNNLGCLLYDQERPQEAEAEFREALRLNPDLVQALNGLGLILDQRGRHQEAEAEFRRAIRLKPDYALAHYNLGLTLGHQGRYKEAEEEFRKALRLKPDSAGAYNDLGYVLMMLGQPKEAEAELRKALRLKPGFALAHVNLGLALLNQDRYREAEVAFREVLRLRRDFPIALCDLGLALQGQGRFGPALEALKRGHELGSRSPGWNYPSAGWVQNCERLIALKHLLFAVLAGLAAPADVNEQLALAHVGLIGQQMPASSLKFYAAAFRREPQRLDDLTAGHRYNAACAAALAGCGRGTDTAALSEAERAPMRRQALDWLRADLAARAKQQGPGAQQLRATLAHWQIDPDLACVREPAALAKLPPEERRAWEKFWTDVAVLRQRASGER